MALFNHARPISETLQNERIRPRIRKLLAEVEPIKKFGETQGLKATPNYREYVQLDRPAAVWVVSACEPLKFSAKTWSFPIVGSFPYLGWFDLENARDFAKDLKAQGWDIDVRGARAYSTLGWFRDAVLSSMVPEGEEALGELVNVILHESVHATLYVSGQSFFDESLASFIADRMTGTYLEQTRGKDAPEIKAYRDSEAEGQENQKLMHQAYLELEKIYASNLPDKQKLESKATILSDLQKKVGAKREITNATLIHYKTYNSGNDQFEGLFKACGGDWRKFLSSLGNLKPESFPAAQTEDLSSVLKPLTDAGCPDPSGRRG